MTGWGVGGGGGSGRQHRWIPPLLSGSPVETVAVLLITTAAAAAVAVSIAAPAGEPSVVAVVSVFGALIAFPGKPPAVGAAVQISANDEVT